MEISAVILGILFVIYLSRIGYSIKSKQNDEKHIQGVAHLPWAVNPQEWELYSIKYLCSKGHNWNAIKHMIHKTRPHFWAAHFDNYVENN